MLTNKTNTNLYNITNIHFYKAVQAVHEIIYFISKPRIIFTFKQQSKLKY